MKITLHFEADSASELQNAVLQLADCCTMINDQDKAESFAVTTAIAAADRAAKPATISTVPTYTTEQVRELIEPVTLAKGAAWIKGLLAEMGATNLSKMDPAQYPELLKRAGVAA